MFKKVLKAILFIIIGVGALLGLAILVDSSGSGNFSSEWISKFLDFTDGFGLIIAEGLRLFGQFFP